MAELIPAHAWHATALGGMQAWPPHLHATVDLMLGHGFPMIVLWGQELLQIYNDGYATVLADKHPGGLGQPTAECWPEVWHINGPIYEQVWQGQTLTYEDKCYPLARRGVLEDAWFTISYSPVRAADGRIDGVLVTMFETTGAHVERVRREAAEAELRESEQRLALALKLLPVGVAVVDHSGNVSVCNDVMHTYLPTHRVPSGDPQNMGRWHGLHADGSPILPQDFAVARALRGETVVPGMEFLFTHDDGSQTWTRVAAAPVRDAAGQVTAVFAIVVDIDELKRGAELLRANEERFRQFSAASSDLLWIRDARSGQVQYLSPAFETIYGVAADTLPPDLPHWAALVVPDDRQTALDHLHGVAAGRTSVHEFRVQWRQDGSFHWVRDTAFPLFDADGSITRIAGISTNVTQSRRWAEHQGVLLSELQHRVRNIMAMINSIAWRTRRSAADVDDYARLLSGRLMSLARTQALLTRAANIGICIRTLIGEELAAQAQDEGQYELRGPELMVPPKAAEVLSLAIHELGTNALKYGALAREDGHVAVSWSLRDEHGQRWLDLHWTERHPPTPDWQPPSRCGFGSALVQERVPYELSGRGQIDFSAEGVDASIQFPLKARDSILETDAPLPPGIPGGSTDMAGEPRLDGQAILVMDDDFYLAHDAAGALRSAGARIIGPCADEATALAAIGVHPPTAAVLDINLGGAPSGEVAALLARMQVPFVLVTGYDQAAVAADLAAVPRLQKPASPRQIVRTLAQLLAR